MRPPKRWMLVLAGCAIAAVVVERTSVLYEPKAKLVIATEAERQHCSTAQAAPVLDAAAVPSVTQPGGIDPLGVSRAIRRVLEDCP